MLLSETKLRVVQWGALVSGPVVSCSVLEEVTDVDGLH